MLTALAGVLLERETMMGKELDELIVRLRPGIQLPSKRIEEDEQAAAAPAAVDTLVEPDDAHARSYRLACGGRVLDLGRRTCVMGVLNVTPDSFSDGGRFLDPSAAVARGERMAAAGPISSTSAASRRGPSPIRSPRRRKSAGWSRWWPSWPGGSTSRSASTPPRPRSRAGRSRPEPRWSTTSRGWSSTPISAAAAEFGAPLVLMHMRGEPRTMQVDPRYEDLVGEIRDHLLRAAERAERMGWSAHGWSWTRAWASARPRRTTSS